MRALARERAGRFPSAAAFLADLRDFVAGEWTGDLPDRIVILDFDNRTQDPGRAWIATALTDALTADLRKAPTLSIAPRDKVYIDRATFVDQSSETFAADVGLRLGCRWALTGAYQSVGEALRVTVNLVDTATQRSILVDKVDGTLSELFDVQDRVSASVLGALNVNLVDSTTSSRRPALSAYELYTRGRHLFLSREKGSMEQAYQLYEQAVQLEPDYALALSGLAGFHAMQFPFTTDSKTLHLAESFARRAIDRDASLADAHNWLGYALWRLGSLRDAHQAWAQAMTLDESWYMPFYFAGSTAHLIAAGDSGPFHMQRAAERAPHLSSPIWGLACLHTQLGNYPEALWCFERTKTVDHATGSAAHWAGFGGFHGECLRRLGRLDEGRRVCLEALEDVERSDHMYRDSNRVVCLVTLGRIALQQRDLPAASAAYRQAIAHV